MPFVFYVKVFHETRCPDNDDIISQALLDLHQRGL
jgi:hypothetical protein